MANRARSCCLKDMKYWVRSSQKKPLISFLTKYTKSCHHLSDLHCQLMGSSSSTLHQITLVGVCKHKLVICQYSMLLLLVYSWKYMHQLHVMRRKWFDPKMSAGSWRALKWAVAVVKEGPWSWRLSWYQNQIMKIATNDTENRKEVIYWSSAALK